MIRAKFRVKRITEETSTVHVEMHPVNPKGQHEPNGSEENARFWKATPSGTAVFAHHGATVDEVRAKYPIGSCFYLDIHQGAVEGQQVYTAGQFTAGGWSLNVTFHPHGHAGRVELGIDNPEAIRLLLPALVDEILYKAAYKIENPGLYQGAPSVAWLVDVTRAD